LIAKTPSVVSGAILFSSNISIIFSFADINGRSWKAYSASPLFKYDAEKSITLLSAYLSNHYGNDRISVEKVSGLRGNREDHDSLKIHITNPDVTIYFLSVNSMEFTLKSEVAVFPLVISSGTVDYFASFLRISRQK